MEQRRIVRLWQQGNAGVLATLVRVEGSSYRRPGARLLISKMGECAGAISGGCLEADVVRRSAWMVRNGAVVERYSTAFDDLAEIPFGLGCGGTLDLWVRHSVSPVISDAHSNIGIRVVQMRAPADAIDSIACSSTLAPASRSCGRALSASL